MDRQLHLPVTRTAEMRALGDEVTIMLWGESHLRRLVFRDFSFEMEIFGSEPVIYIHAMEYQRDRLALLYGDLVRLIAKALCDYLEALVPNLLGRTPLAEHEEYEQRRQAQF